MNTFHTYTVDLCTFEAIGGGLEPPVIHIGDYAMTSDQARALASALTATADLTDMTRASKVLSAC